MRRLIGVRPPQGLQRGVYSRKVVHNGPETVLGAAYK
jgi:hypothetical protein